MSFPRVNPPGWAANAALDKALLNQMDIDHAAALRQADIDAAKAIAFHAPRAISTSHILRRGVFSFAESRWYCCAENLADHINFSVNGGHDWAAIGTASGLFITDIAIDPATGNMVAVSTTGSVLEYAKSTTTWTSRAAGFAGSVVGATVTWSASASLWFVIYRDGPNGLKCYTSPDRIAWTSRTGSLPGNLTSYTGTNNPQIGSNPAGRIVVLLDTPTNAAGTTSANSRAFAISSDGGLTWPNTGSIPSSLTSSSTSTLSKPVWSPTDAVWMLAISAPAASVASPTSEVWTSPDVTAGAAVIFSRVYTSTSGAQLTNLVNSSDTLWAALDASVTPAAITYSTDVGVSWRRSPYTPLKDDAIVWLLASSFSLLMLGETGPNVAVPRFMSGHNIGSVV